jgi:hypothetical protein
MPTPVLNTPSTKSRPEGSARAISPPISPYSGGVGAPPGSMWVEAYGPGGLGRRERTAPKCEKRHKVGLATFSKNAKNHQIQHYSNILHKSLQIYAFVVQKICICTNPSRITAASAPLEPTLACTPTIGESPNRRGVVLFLALSCDNSAIARRRKVKVSLRAHGPGGTLCTCAPRQLRAPCKMVRWEIILGGVPFLAGVGINKGPPPPGNTPPKLHPQIIAPFARIYYLCAQTGR